MRVAIIENNIILSVVETNIESPDGLRLIHVGDLEKQLLDDDHQYQVGDEFIKPVPAPVIATSEPVPENGLLSKIGEALGL